MSDENITGLINLYSSNIKINNGLESKEFCKFVCNFCYSGKISVALWLCGHACCCLHIED